MGFSGLDILGTFLGSKLGSYRTDNNDIDPFFIFKTS
jgi:hypothetical protein